MGFFDWIKSAASKVGDFVKGAAQKVGEVFQNPVGAIQKIGDIASMVQKGAQAALPFIGNIPVVGGVARAIAGSGGIIKGIQDVGERLGKGDIGGAIQSGLETAAPLLPGGIGKAAMRILPVVGAARREFDF